jgi:uncharacterized membrane protein YfcA
MAAIPLIALAAYVILGISGFGSALVNIPLLAHFLPIHTIVPMIVTVDFSATIATQLRFRGDIEISELKLIVPGMIVGIVVGVTLLATLPARITLLLLGIFVTGYGVYRLLSKSAHVQIPRWWGVPTGLVGGLLGGLFGVGGPVYAAYLAGRIADPARMRTTLAAIFSISTGFRLVIFLLSGLLLQAEVWWGVALMLPGMLAGLLIGYRLHGRLRREQAVMAVNVLLLASGLSLLMRAI